MIFISRQKVFDLFDSRASSGELAILTFTQPLPQQQHIFHHGQVAFLLFQLFWDDEDRRGRDCRAGLVLQLLREGKEREAREGRAKASRRRSSPIARELHTVQNQDWTLDHIWAQI